MFNPSRDEARQFFFDTWRKYHAGETLSDLEKIALRVISLHPEYHALLDDRERHLEHDYTPQDGGLNPFLHLSLHLAIEEQLSIDQPPGIRAAVEALARRRDSTHAARHDVMDCLAEVIWNAQRHAAAFANAPYRGYIEARGRAEPRNA